MMGHLGGTGGGGGGGDGGSSSGGGGGGSNLDLDCSTSTIFINLSTVASSASILLKFSTFLHISLLTVPSNIFVVLF